MGILKEMREMVRVDICISVYPPNYMSLCQHTLDLPHPHCPYQSAPLWHRSSKDRYTSQYASGFQGAADSADSERDQLDREISGPRIGERGGETEDIPMRSFLIDPGAHLRILDLSSLRLTISNTPVLLSVLLTPSSRLYLTPKTPEKTNPRKQSGAAKDQFSG